MEKRVEKDKAKQQRHAQSKELVHSMVRTKKGAPDLRNPANKRRLEEQRQKGAKALSKFLTRPAPKETPVLPPEGPKKKNT